MSQNILLKPNDPTILVSSSPVSKQNSETEPMALVQQTSGKKIKMTEEEVKSKIKALKNYIKQVKKTDTGKSVASHTYAYT